MTMLKSYNVAFVLALLLPLAHVGAVDAKPSSSSSFKSGFSSQRSSSPSRPSYSSAKSSGTSFGSFSRRSAPPDAAPQQSKSSGGFGSFGRGSAAPQKSDSALSQKLDRNTSEANASRGAHANNNGYPGGYAGGTAPAPAGGGMSFLGVFLTLCMLALIGWGLYFAWRRLRRGRKAKKPNYSFERN